VAVRAVGAQFARYGAVGISNTLLSAACYAALISLGADAVAAATIAFALGSVNGFLWNRRWTFAGMLRTSHAWLRFTIAQATGALASAGGVFVLTNAGWPRLAAECVILPCVTAALYSVSRLLVFRSISA